MSTLRIALAQINPTVGDLTGNSELVLATCHRAAGAGAQLVAFPEMALTGYPVEDLALRNSFQQASTEHTRRIAELLRADGLGHLTVVLGVLAAEAGSPQNAAAILHDGRVEQVYVKHHLPNYGVFDERRLFAPGDQACVIEVGGVSASIAICEDLWQPDSPAQLAANDADLLLVINASPFEQGKHHQRVELCQLRAAQTGSTVAYVNTVGAQDELVFDGGSMVITPDGTTAVSSPRFSPDLLTFDFTPDPAGLSPGTPPANPRVSGVTGAESGAETPETRGFAGSAGSAGSAGELDELGEVYQALTVGLRDYVVKNRIGSVVLGMSGGIDSAFVAALACDALGAENVYGIAMPSAYSSSHSVEDAHDSAARTGMNLRQVPIASVFDSYQQLLGLSGLAEENLQARIRGTTLMAVSNSEGQLVLATGNKSELAVGYSTIYGDAVGGFAPIKDVPKTLVWQLSRWRNEQAERLGTTPPIPPRSISKPPSAELRPGQLDTDSLPDYAELDAVVAQYVEGGVSAADLIAQGFNPELARRIIRLTDAAEYKRRQYPPGTKITRLAFGRDRRMPITNRWSEPGAVGG